MGVKSVTDEFPSLSPSGDCDTHYFLHITHTLLQKTAESTTSLQSVDLVFVKTSLIWRLTIPITQPSNEAKRQLIW